MNLQMKSPYLHNHTAVLGFDASFLFPSAARYFFLAFFRIAPSVVAFGVNAFGLDIWLGKRKRVNRDECDQNQAAL